MNTDLPSLPHPDSRLVQGASHVVRRLKDAGFIAFWAGGCVRDMLLGRAPKDYDIATNAVPDEVIKLFPSSLTVGKAFGVVRIPVGDHDFEVATFRQDHAYEDGRRPSGVTFSDPETDAQRRDFTINAMFYDPGAGTIIDYVGGQADLQRRLIRAVGCADERFQEDHLRMMRAIRFAGSLDFSLDPDTAAAIRHHTAAIQKVSVERVQQEFTRLLLESKRAGDALALLDQVGLMSEFLPELKALQGQEQPPQFHPEGDVWTHTLMMLNALQERSLDLAYAVLLHDIGKPPTARWVDGRIRFDQHAGHGAVMAETVLKRLKLPHDNIKAIAFAISNHMRFMDVRKMRKATLCRLVGAPTFPLELELHRLDCEASHRDMQNFDFLVAFQEACRQQPALPEPWVSGHDVMALSPVRGPDVGLWKQLVYDAQLDGTVQSRDEALAWLKARIPT